MDRRGSLAGLETIGQGKRSGASGSGREGGGERGYDETLRERLEGEASGQFVSVSALLGLWLADAVFGG